MGTLKPLHHVKVMVQGEVLMIVFYETKLNSEYIVQIANTQVDKLMYMKQD